MAKKLTPAPKKRVLVATIITIATLVIAWLCYTWFIHYQDRQKFMTLRADMLALQTEFNKIDPGWQYSESCHAKGEKFKEGEASSCGISISLESQSISPKEYDMLLKSYISNSTRNEFEHQGYKYIEIYGAYEGSKGVKCSQLQKEKSGITLLSLQCSSSALDFYFPRSQ